MDRQLEGGGEEAVKHAEYRLHAAGSLLWRPRVSVLGSGCKDRVAPAAFCHVLKGLEVVNLTFTS